MPLAAAPFACRKLAALPLRALLTTLQLTQHAQEKAGLGLRASPAQIMSCIKHQHLCSSLVQGRSDCLLPGIKCSSMASMANAHNPAVVASGVAG
jgi:hypothetical protein